MFDFDLKSRASNKPFICLEVNPPRGTEWEEVFNRYKDPKGIDFFNVTDSALAKMRCSSLPFAAELKRRTGIEPMVNVSCRDRNVISLQGDLLSSWALGVRSVVALTGDAVSVGDNPDAKGVFEINSVGLLNLIGQLNKSVDIRDNPLKGGCAFKPGVVVNPNAKNLNAELRRLEKKKNSGAIYALSQPMFDSDAALKFLESASSIGVPIFLGLLAFKSAKGAKAVAENVPGIKLDDKILEIIQNKQDEDLSEFFIERCCELASRTKGVVTGFHVISGANPNLAMRLVRILADL